MGKYDNLANNIVSNVGGADNVESLVHCFTRLRFVLKDESKADKNKILENNKVVDVIQAGGQYQIVIGMDVSDVFEDINAIYHFKGGNEVIEDSEAKDADLKKMTDNRSTWDKVIDIFSSIFVPLINILCASGIIKGLLAILSAAHILQANDGTYIVLNAIGDALFYFFPVFLAITAGRKFKVEQFTSVAIGASIIYPTLISVLSGKAISTIFTGTIFESKIYITFLHIPLILNNYSSTVIPIILAIWFASYIEKWTKKWMPKAVANFMVPVVVLLIVVPISLLIIGPVATWLSNVISWIVMALYKLNPMLFGAFIGGFWQILVIFGIHTGLVPIILNNLATQGYDYMWAANVACCFTQLAVLCALAIRIKNNNKIKKNTIAAIFPAIFGITEPAIYGVTLSLKKPFIISCLSSAIGGALAMVLNLKFYRMGGQGIFVFPVYLPDNASNWNGIINALIVVIVSMAIAFVTMLITYREKDTDPYLMKNSSK